MYANVSAILPPPKGYEKMIPERPKDEQPTKWVLEKIAQAVPDVNAELAATDDDNPFN